VSLFMATSKLISPLLVFITMSYNTCVSTWRW
jgi:hypothetical protein